MFPSCSMYVSVSEFFELVKMAVGISSHNRSNTIYLLLALATFMQGVHVLERSSICGITNGNQGKNTMICWNKHWLVKMKLVTKLIM